MADESPFGVREISPVATGEWVDVDLSGAGPEPRPTVEHASQPTAAGPPASHLESSSGEALPTDSVVASAASPTENVRGVEHVAGAAVEKEIAPGGFEGSAAPSVSEAGAASPFAASAEKGVAPFDEFSTVPASIQQRLASREAAERAAAITELSHVDTDEAFWDRVIELNFKGCLRTCRRTVPRMVERGYGRVVNIASDAARVGSSLEAVYSGAKGGVVSFTKTLAREVARHGVTANAVCPGPTQTPMLNIWPRAPPIADGSLSR